MSAPDFRPRRDIPHGAIEKAAADWLVRRQNGLSAAEQEELRQWLGDPRNEAAFAAMNATWRVLSEPLATGKPGELRRLLELKAQQRFRRNRRLLVAAGLAAAATWAVVLWPTSPSPPPSPAHRPAAALPTTVAARPDRRELPDGSSVELNAGARIEVAFDHKCRRIALLAGEAMFAVVQDPGRPFVVTAGAVEVRAVGTAFSVRHAGGEVGVLVTAGRVAVERAPTRTGESPPTVLPAPVAFLEAGARLVVPADLPPATPLEIKPITDREVAAALAWRDRRIELSGTPIGEVVAIFNRHNRAKLEVSDPVLARHQLSGVFWSDDPEGFARLLEAGMGVVAERTSDVILLRRQ